MRVFSKKVRPLFLAFVGSIGLLASSVAFGQLVKCADENGTCNVSAQSAVVYGKNSTWIGKVANAPSIACNNATFTDPLYGTVKECQTKTVASMTVCAQENGTCATPTPSLVLYLSLIHI